MNPPLPQPPDDEALAAEVTTTTAMTDLLESLGVLAAGAGVTLLFARSWLGLVLLVLAALFLWLSYRRRARNAFRNEQDLRDLKYEFSAAQIQTMIAAPLAPGATTALQFLNASEPVSRWQVETLLQAHMGEAPAAQALPLVLSYAQKRSGKLKAAVSIIP
jgi:hypothetical protein